MKRLLVLLFFAVMVIGCFAQPKSPYDVTWVPETNTEMYLIFLQETTNADSNAMVLKDNIDYKLVNAVPYLIDSVLAPTTTYSRLLFNDGKYYRYAVVGRSAQKIYGPAGVTWFTKKPTAPAKISGLKTTRQ